jgi:plasmid stabilization system protein ParE
MHLVVVEAALDEAELARNHYTNINPELGDDFASELQIAINGIIAHPMAWSPVGRRARRRLLSRFPYAVIYRVETDLIRIVAVMHQRQRPGYWRGR